MNETRPPDEPLTDTSDVAQMGLRAAHLIWHNGPGLDELHDPRTIEFASAVIDGLSAALASSPGALQTMMRNASNAAEDLNVGQFQGLVEVIQNADDVRANEVRFMLQNQR